MSGSIANELREVPADRENQDLKEILEIAFQITAQLEMENVIQNVAWSLVSKFKLETVTAALPGEMDESPVQVLTYKGLRKEAPAIALPSILPILNFLDKDEYSQVAFS